MLCISSSALIVVGRILLAMIAAEQAGGRTMRGTMAKLGLNRNVVALAWLAITLCAFGCAASSEVEPGRSGAVCTATSTLTYESFGQPFMQSYCLRCHSEAVAAADRHGAPSDVNLDTLDEVRMHAGHIDEHAAAGEERINTEMPPDGSAPSVEERRLLGEWLACGAP
jgi:uncharacterized membrane protein